MKHDISVFDTATRKVVKTYRVTNLTHIDDMYCTDGRDWTIGKFEIGGDAPAVTTKVVTDRRSPA